MNLEARKNQYNWKGGIDFIKDDVKPPSDWASEKQILLKRINELEKELKYYKKENQELTAKLNPGQIQNSGNKNIPNSGHSSHSNSSVSNQFLCPSTLAASVANISDKKGVTGRLVHKRVESEIILKNEELYSNKRQDRTKSKQNSDDITRSDALKRLFKKKPKSFGGCPEKMLENKLLDNILMSFKKDLVKIQDINEKEKVSSINEGSSRIKSSTIHIASDLDSTGAGNQHSYSSRHPNPAPLASNFKQGYHRAEIPNVFSSSITKLSEKEEESSVNTQETILQKPKNFNITNSYSNEVNRSNSNIITTENPMNTSSSRFYIQGNEHEHLNTLNTNTNSFSNDMSIHMQSSSNNVNQNQSHASDDNLSRSSIIFQPLGRSNQSENSIEVRRSMNNLHVNLGKMSFNPIVILKSHLDSVREVYVDPEKQTLVSIGEDMLLNFWDFQKFLKQSKESIEPYLTVRTHTTPIFTLTGPQRSMGNRDECVYSSGIDGVIRCNRIPDKTHNVEGMVTDNTLLPWRGHQDMIWQLEYHRNEALMSSVSADGSVKIFKGYEEANTDKLYYSYDSRSKNLVRQLIFRNHYYNFIEIPTSCSWSPKQDNILYVSYIASYIKSYDIETGKNVSDILYPVEKHIPFESQQANKILLHADLNLIVTGHEDRQIRFFDPNQNKLIKSFVAHTDAVSCITLGLKENELVSASHDGSVRCWDLRNSKLLFDIPAHRKKFDEGCLSIKTIPGDNLMITSGADGLIKVFQLN